MAFDGIVTKAVIAELNHCLINGKINKIFEPNKNEILCNKIVSGQLLVKELVNLDDNELQEIINKMINIADLEERKEVDNVQEII